MHKGVVAQEELHEAAWALARVDQGDRPLDDFIYRSTLAALLRI